MNIELFEVEYENSRKTSSPGVLCRLCFIGMLKITLFFAQIKMQSTVHPCFKCFKTLISQLLIRNVSNSSVPLKSNSYTRQYKS